MIPADLSLADIALNRSPRALASAEGILRPGKLFQRTCFGANPAEDVDESYGLAFIFIGSAPAVLVENDNCRVKRRLLATWSLTG